MLTNRVVPPQVHCSQECQQNWIQSRMWSAQQTEHSYNNTQQRNTVIQSICSLFNLGSTVTRRLVFQHMHAYLVLLNKRKCYPVPLFHRRKKRRHLKAMLCRGTNTLRSSSFPTTIKKKIVSKSPEHRNPCTICRLNYLSPPGLSMLCLSVLSCRSSWLTSIC